MQWWESSDHRDLYGFMKKRGKRRKQEGENEMGLLSYKIVRGTCLGFSEQLQVIVTCDVLQQRLTTAAMGLFVLLERVKQWELRNRFMYLLRVFVILSAKTEHVTLTVYLSFCSLRGAEFLFLLISVTFSLYRSCRSVWAWRGGNSENVRASWG